MERWGRWSSYFGRALSFGGIAYSYYTTNKRSIQDREEERLAEQRRIRLNQQDFAELQSRRNSETQKAQANNRYCRALDTKSSLLEKENLILKKKQEGQNLAREPGDRIYTPEKDHIHQEKNKGD